MPKNQFTSEYQPDPKAISKGKKKAFALKKLAKMKLVSSKAKDVSARYLKMGIDLPAEAIDVSFMLCLPQVEQAYQDKDTRSFIAIMDRLLGKPAQAVDVTTDGEALPQQTIIIKRYKDPEAD